ncbi:ComEA family DNA-binding protein [Amylolactobacillus amylophilus]|uniref:ComEA family DNA-binding protein n=1 Tax=Amylolactobacillus amylophilus TaxID=1603 RepID=UPI0034E29006
MSENTTGDAGSGKGTAAAAKIDINQATVSELQELNGIGEKKAEQIVTYREENGPFKDAKELTNVSGIGDKTFEGLADQVTV